MTLKALVIYFSPGGNTRKAAEAIGEGLASQGADVTLGPLHQLKDEDLLAYDLVCIGAPSYHFGVPAPVKRYTEHQMRVHNAKGNLQLRTPLVPGKWGVVFITYSGPHSGIDEATPAGDHLAQMLVHLGYRVRGEWYVVGEFHHGPDSPSNLRGFMGDIRGRPDEHDLGVVRRNAAGLAYTLVREKEELACE
jgi:multimeric flavodoxin WrbA